jgi:predicted small metal-binding protein
MPSRFVPPELPDVTAFAGTERQPAPGGFRLRCAEVHPVHCDVALESPSTAEVVARIRAHGASAHGYTPVWYSSSRLASMAAAVIR